MLGKFVSGFYPNWDQQEFDRLLKVLDLPAHRRFSELSGGMRMKLGLTIALTPRPALLILDEPTSGLDPVAQREFIEIIQHQASEYGRTTFFSTHRIEEVDRAAHQIGIIDQGKMRFEGHVDQLRDGVRRVTQTEFHQDPDAPPRDHPWADTSRFEVLSEGTVGGLRRWVVKTDPQYWQDSLPAGYRIEPMTLEDVFIAYASVGGLEKL